MNAKMNGHLLHVDVTNVPDAAPNLGSVDRHCARWLEGRDLSSRVPLNRYARSKRNLLDAEEQALE